MLENNKIRLRFSDLTKHFKLTDYVKEGDEIILRDYDCFFRIKIVHIYAGVIFYKIIKKLLLGSTKWKRVSSKIIHNLSETSVWASQTYPTEINAYDWFHPDTLKIFKFDTLYGAIKVNYEGKFKNDPEELTLKKK